MSNDNNDTDTNKLKSRSEYNHVLTCIEAYWVETNIVSHPDGKAFDNIKILDDDTIEPVANTKHAWEFTCSCGEEFYGYDEAVAHLAEPHQSD